MEKEEMIVKIEEQIAECKKQHDEEFETWWYWSNRAKTCSPHEIDECNGIADSWLAMASSHTIQIEFLKSLLI